MTAQNATVVETLHAERTCLIIDGSGALGEAIPTGRTFRVRTVLFQDGTTECLSIEVQFAPGGAWHRQAETAGPALGDWSGMSDRKARETTGQDDPFQDARDALDIEKTKGWLASETLLGTMRGENIMLKVNLRRVQRGLPALAF